MLFVRLSKSLFVAALVLLPLACQSQPSSSATAPGILLPVPAIANPPGAPTEIVSTTASTGDLLSAITVKNFSDKTVVSFQIGVIMSVPEGCGAKSGFGDEIAMPADRANLKQGQTMRTENYNLAPRAALDFGATHGAKAVHSQVAVIHVEFDDGSSWSVQRSGPMYDLKLMQESAKLQCAGRPQASCVHPRTSADSSPLEAKPSAL